MHAWSQFTAHIYVFQKGFAKTQRGFSLIEMLVYISILVLVSGGALTMLFSLTDHLNTVRAERLLSSSAEVALERMLGDIRGADMVDTFYSTFQTTPGELTLIAGASTTAFSVLGTDIVMAKDGVTIGSLIDSHVVVDSLRFYRYDNSHTELIRISMVLTATVGKASTTKTFEAAAVLRGSYE